jgi:hypothetical protein
MEASDILEYEAALRDINELLEILGSNRAATI